jgi:acetyl esterase/lipase
MSFFEDRVDPEIISAMPPGMDRMLGSIGPDSMGPIREDRLSLLMQTIEDRPPFEGRHEHMTAPGLDGGPDVPVIFYQHAEAEYPETVLVWLHGGGYVMGDVKDLTVHRYTPLMSVISVDYRMAPEHRSPAAAQDACAVLEWAAREAAALGINPDRIILGGPSGGGGLAAGAALLNRDRGGPTLMYQLLIYPMIDDVHDTPSGHMKIPPQFWTRDVSLLAWSMYVEEEGASIYAAAARAGDVRGLPPTYIMVGELDLFRDENITYARRLIAAGIAVDLAVFPGAPHGFDMLVPDAGVSRRALEHQIASLRSVMAPSALA